MPFTPLHPKVKRAVLRLRKRKPSMRKDCYMWHGRTIIRMHKLGLYHRVRVWCILTK